MSNDTTLLWLAELSSSDEATTQRHISWLSESEKQKLQQFVRPVRRRQFIAGRALLRSALGSLFSSAPNKIVLHERAGMAPSLGHSFNGGFSISHTGPWVACAVSAATAVGIDIERVNPHRDVLHLAEHAFAGAQLDGWRALPPHARCAAFYQMWCAYEARIKLGTSCGADYRLSVEGLAGSLACAVPLKRPAVLRKVSLDTLTNHPM